MAKRDHLKDYVATEDGGYEYRGLTWRWPSPEARSAFVKTCWGLLAGAIVCQAISGFLPPAQTGNAFFVLIPYAVSVIASALMAASLYRITREGDVMRDHVYQSSVARMRPWGLMGSIGAGIAFVGELALALASGLGAGAFAFAALMLATAAAFVLLFRRASSLALEPDTEL